MKKTDVVVITGGSAGLGRAIALSFAKKKCTLAILARDKERLTSLQKEAEALGSVVKVFPVDVSDSDEVQKIADTIEHELGAIDIWINNTMVSVFSPAKEMEAKEYKRVTEVTYLSYVYGTLSALKYMLPRDKGIIIQVGSALAYRGIPLQSAYSAAKHAIQGFTESVRCELIHDKSNVKISMVQLPGMNTTQFNWAKSRLPRKLCPVPPIFQPEVAAEAIVWASYHYRREWYVGSSTVVAIIGNKLFPAIGDWYLGKTGFKSQQYDGLANADRPNNLYQTVPGRFGSHGDFDHKAYNFSLQFWCSKHRIWIFLFLCLLLILFIGIAA